MFRFVRLVPLSLLSVLVGAGFVVPALARDGQGADLVGRVERVSDGDTLHVAGTKVRIWGIDAPEKRQACTDGSGAVYACGVIASLHLNSIAIGRIAECRVVDTDKYGRTVASCRVEGHDLGSAMVRSGLATDYVQFSHGHYAADEAMARADRLGIWSGAFVPPADWRRVNANQR